MKLMMYDVLHCIIEKLIVSISNLFDFFIHCLQANITITNLFTASAKLISLVTY